MEYFYTYSVNKSLHIVWEIFQIVQIFYMLHGQNLSNMTLNHVYAPVTDDNFTTAEINQTKHWSFIVDLLNKITQNIGLW